MSTKKAIKVLTKMWQIAYKKERGKELSLKEKLYIAKHIFHVYNYYYKGAIYWKQYIGFPSSSQVKTVNHEKNTDNFIDPVFAHLMEQQEDTDTRSV